MSHRPCRKPPGFSILLNPRSLARDRREAEIGRPRSGEVGRRRRGPRGGEVSGAHDGSIAPRVEGCGGRKSGSRREPEVEVEGFTVDGDAPAAGVGGGPAHELQ
jgi:hypothetical protein